jgi:O-antigen/teichoic acid export membrane protein
MHLAVALFALLVAWQFARRSIPRITEPMDGPLPLRLWLGTGLPLTAIGILNFLKMHFVILLCGHLLSMSDAGIYALVLQLSAITTFGYETATLIAAPRISVLFQQNRRSELRRLSSRCAWLGTSFSLLPVMASIVFGKAFLESIDPAYVVGYSSLVVLSVTFALNAVAGPVGYLLTMTGYQMACLKVLFIAAALNIVVSIVLIPSLGILGAAVGNATAVVFWNVTLIGIVRGRLGLWSFLGRIT